MSGIMAGAAVLGAGGAGAGGSPATITIESVTLTFSDTISTVYSGYRLQDNGDIEHQQNFAGRVNIGQWCTPGGNASDFEVRATLVSGTVSGSAVGSWLSFPAGFSAGYGHRWIVTDSTANGTPNEAVLTIEIRDKVTLLVRDTATVTIRANKV